MSVEQQPFEARLTVPGRIESVRPAAAFLVEAARSRHIPAVEKDLFEVAVVEALNNALKHNPRGGDEPLHCELDIDGNRLRIRILDEAARAPVAIALPAHAAPLSVDGPDNWEQLPESGYGLYLIQAVFPHVRSIARDGAHGVEMELMF